ncbi:hypothetical protein H632_c1416p0, partial [Helicosporidium sp. ATCC 50920]
AERLLRDLCAHLAERLEESGARARQLTLKVLRRAAGEGEPAKFLGCGRCDAFSRSAVLPAPARALEALHPVALQLLRRLAVEPGEIRGMGVASAKLLFDEELQAGGQTSVLDWLHRGEKPEEEEGAREASLDASLRRPRRGPPLDALLATTPIPVLPAPAVVDPEVLAALPPSVRRELEQAYRSRGLRLWEEGRAQGAALGWSRGNREGARGERAKKEAVRRAGPAPKPSAALKGREAEQNLTLSQLDPQVMAALPESIRREILGACLGGRPTGQEARDWRAGNATTSRHEPKRCAAFSASTRAGVSGKGSATAPDRLPCCDDSCEVLGVHADAMVQSMRAASDMDQAQGVLNTWLRTLESGKIEWRNEALAAAASAHVVAHVAHLSTADLVGARAALRWALDLLDKWDTPQDARQGLQMLVSEIQSAVKERHGAELRVEAPWGGHGLPSPPAVRMCSSPFC